MPVFLWRVEGPLSLPPAWSSSGLDGLGGGGGRCVEIAFVAPEGQGSYTHKHFWNTYCASATVLGVRGRAVNEINNVS